MIGKDEKEVAAMENQDPGERSIREGKPFLEIKNFGRKGSIAPLDLSIRGGEVVGLAGLLGSGRTETARIIFGVDKPDSGEMFLDGERVTIASPCDAIRRRLAFTVRCLAQSPACRRSGNGATDIG
jgi:galactofuranose transport system ATP-binding protein